MIGPMDQSRAVFLKPDEDRVKADGMRSESIRQPQPNRTSADCGVRNLADRLVREFRGPLAGRVRGAPRRDPPRWDVIATCLGRQPANRECQA